MGTLLGHPRGRGDMGTPPCHPGGSGDTVTPPYCFGGPGDMETLLCHSGVTGPWGRFCATTGDLGDPVTPPRHPGGGRGDTCRPPLTVSPWQDAKPLEVYSVDFMVDSTQLGFLGACVPPGVPPVSPPQCPFVPVTRRSPSFCSVRPRPQPPGLHVPARG